MHSHTSSILKQKIIMKVELLNIFKEGIRTENEDVCVRNLNYG